MERSNEAIFNPIAKGRELRFVPVRDSQTIASSWKFWVSGNEVYATSRTTGEATRISVHASGQIHMHMGGRDLQKFAPSLPFDNGDWLHAFELRFLLSTDANHPLPDLQPQKQILAIEVAPDQMLILNLLISRMPLYRPALVPQEFAPGLPPLWERRLKDGRSVVMPARLMELDSSNRALLSSVRQELRPQVILSQPLASPAYAEFRHVSSGASTGNVITIIPMGEEAFRSFPVPANEHEQPVAEKLLIHISLPNASYPVTAPDGAVIGTLTFTGVELDESLTRDISLDLNLGAVSLTMHASALLFGQSFHRPSLACPCVPTIDGIQPRKWVFTAIAKFDGDELSVEIRPQSISFRNVNLERPMQVLSSVDALMFAAPAEIVTLRVTREVPVATMPLNSKLLLHTH